MENSQPSRHCSNFFAHLPSWIVMWAQPSVLLLFSHYVHVRLFASSWTAACQAPLSFSISQSLLKLMSIESVMPSNHLNLCHPLLLSFPPSQSFPVSWLFASGGQSIRASVSASVLPLNIQGWFPLGLSGLILLSKGLSRVFINSTVQKHQFFGPQPSLWSSSHICTWLLGKP